MARCKERPPGPSRSPREAAILPSWEGPSAPAWDASYACKVYFMSRCMARCVAGSTTQQHDAAGEHRHVLMYVMIITHASRMCTDLPDGFQHQLRKERLELAGLGSLDAHQSLGFGLQCKVAPQCTSKRLLRCRTCAYSQQSTMRTSSLAPSLLAYITANCCVRKPQPSAALAKATLPSSGLNTVASSSAWSLRACAIMFITHQSLRHHCARTQRLLRKLLGGQARCLLRSETARSPVHSACCVCFRSAYWTQCN